MKARGRFISFLLIVDTALGGFTYGFNSRHCLVIDPALPPVKIQEKRQPVESAPKAKEALQESKGAKEKKASTGHKSLSGEKTGKTKKHKAAKKAKEK